MGQAIECNECDRRVVRVSEGGQCEWCEAEEAKVFARVAAIDATKAAKVAVEQINAGNRAQAELEAAEANRLFDTDVPAWFARENLGHQPSILAGAWCRHEKRQAAETEWWKKMTGHIVQGEMFEAVEMARQTKKN